MGPERLPFGDSRGPGARAAHMDCKFHYRVMRRGRVTYAVEPRGVLRDTRGAGEETGHDSG